MKEVRGIKVPCIAAIVLNGGFAIFLLLMMFVIIPGSPPRGAEFFSFWGVVLGLLISALYPILILLIRRTYYRHRPVTSFVTILLHISRIIQLLFTCFITVVVVFGIFEIISGMRRYRNTTYPRDIFYPGLVAGIIVAGIIVNSILFFKGWRLLKIVRTPYIDEVMASFD